MEFIALLLLAPLIWSTETPPAPVVAEQNSPKVEAQLVAMAAPRIQSVDGQWIIRPPQDESLTMTVLEHRTPPSALRGPASAGRIDVIVSAP